MTSLDAALARAARVVEGRLADLEGRATAGDETVWPAYLETLAAAVTLKRTLAPGARGEMLTTAEMADRLQLSTKTVLRKVKAGQLKPERFGKRGRGALRWSA